MSELSAESLEAALARRTSSTGEVYPSAWALIDAEEHWTGRFWDVARLVMADQETMRYLAGGNRPAEIAECVARWSDCDLALDDIKMILAAGGYDPDPFVPLARAGLLRCALYFNDGATRIIHGERAGAWISDTLALSSGQEILESVERMVSSPIPAK